MGKKIIWAIPYNVLSPSWVLTIDTCSRLAVYPQNIWEALTRLTFVNEMDKTNNVEILCPANPEGGEIVWQPVMMVPVNSRLDRPLNYPGMKVIAVRIFSAICIILGIASIGVQVNNRLIGQRVRIKFFFKFLFKIAALVIYSTSLFNCVVSQMDVVGHGIWAGALYLTAGSLAIATSTKRTQSL